MLSPFKQYCGYLNPEGLSFKYISGHRTHLHFEVYQWRCIERREATLLCLAWPQKCLWFCAPWLHQSDFETLQHPISSYKLHPQPVWRSESTSEYQELVYPILWGEKRNVSRWYPLTPDISPCYQPCPGSPAVTKHPWIPFEHQSPPFWGAPSAWQPPVCQMGRRQWWRTRLVPLSSISLMGPANCSIETLTQNV